MTDRANYCTISVGGSEIVSNAVLRYIGPNVSKFIFYRSEPLRDPFYTNAQNFVKIRKTIAAISRFL